MNEEQKRSIVKLGGIASLLTTVSLLILAIFLALDPAERKAHDEFWEVLTNHQTMFKSWHTAFVFTAIFMIAIVLGMSVLNYHKNEGIMRFITVMAIIALAVMLVENLRLVTLTHYLTFASNENDPVYFRAMRCTLTGGLDHDGWLQYITMGIWYLAISVFGYKYKYFDKKLYLSGMIITLCYLGILVTGVIDDFNSLYGRVFRTQTIIVAISGIIISPIYHSILGLHLIKLSKSDKII